MVKLLGDAGGVAQPGQAGHASTAASTTPSLTLRSRVSTLPRRISTAMSGRSRRSCNIRRMLEVPTRAPAGSAANPWPVRLTRASRAHPPGDGHHAQADRQPGRHVLEAVHRQVDPPLGQRPLDLLDPQPLAAEVSQQAGRAAIALGHDNLLLDHQPGVLLAQPVGACGRPASAPGRCPACR